MKNIFRKTKEESYELKERFDKILKEHWIYEEAEDVLYAVHDMIAAVADDMEYSDLDATSTIRRLNNTSIWCKGYTQAQRDIRKALGI